MTEFIDRWSWCAVQVTLFAVVGTILYLSLRRQNSLRSLLPAKCLYLIGALTLLAFAPWPNWNWLQWQPVDGATPSNAVAVIEDDIRDTEVTFQLDLSRISESTKPIRESVPSTGRLLSSSPTKSVEQLPSATDWKRLLILLAVIIILAALCRLLIAVRELFARVTTSRRIEEAATLAELKRLQGLFQISRPISLRETPREDVPSTVGWRKPVVLLPRSWRNWSTDQLRAVLAHELAHVENHHFATWIAVQLPLLLHSYHPLVHWLARRLRWE